MPMPRWTVLPRAQEKGLNSAERETKMIRSSAKKGLAALAAVTAAFVLLDIPLPWGSTLGNMLADKIVYPLQSAASGAVGAGEGEGSEGELSQLREENRRLRDMLIGYYDAISENEELRRFFGLKEENDSLGLLPATVIGRDSPDGYSALILDKGGSDGIKTDDLVVTENGLVGRVSTAEEHSCRVVTILSPDADIGAVIKRTGGGGMLSGRPSLAAGGSCILTGLPAHSGCKKGDIAVTSGRSGVYPANIRIGAIAEIAYDPVTALPEAVIEPFENIRRVTAVAVITDFSGRGGLSSERIWIGERR